MVVFRGLIIFAGLAVIGPADAEPVASYFTLNGERQDFPVVSAFRVRDQSNAQVFQTYVLLTKTAPDREAIKNSDNPYTVAINDPATADDHLSLFVDADGTVGLNAHVGGVQYLDSSGQIFNQPGSLSAECASNSESQVACEVNTRKPVETPSDKRWEFAAVFDTEVLSRPPGKPVAEGGGQAGEALSQLSAALEGDDLESILAWLSPDTADRYRADWRTPEENLEAVKETLAISFPKHGTVTSGEYRGDDEVSLLVQAVLENWGEDPVIFQVHMVRGGDHWLYDSGRFVGFVE